MTGALFMLRCKEMGLTDDELSQMSMGMVFDLAVEKVNDTVEYPYKATDEDIQNYWG